MRSIYLVAASLIMAMNSGCFSKASTAEPQSLQADAAPAQQAAPATQDSANPAALSAPNSPSAAQADSQPAPIASPAPPSAAPAEAQIQAEQSCPQGKKAGDSWANDCNTCTCTEDGRVACTLKACVDIDVNEPKSTVRCSNGRKAGESWKNDCNTCSCNDKGEIACTLKACIG